MYSKTSFVKTLLKHSDEWQFTKIPIIIKSSEEINFKYLQKNLFIELTGTDHINYWPMLFSLNIISLPFFHQPAQTHQFSSVHPFGCQIHLQVWPICSSKKVTEKRPAPTCLSISCFTSGKCPRNWKRNTVFIKWNNDIY